MSRSLEQIDREIAARRSDAGSCAVLLKRAEQTADEAKLALDAASDAMAKASQERAAAEGRYATSAALEDATAIDEADRALRHSTVLQTGAAERHARAVDAFRSAEISFNGNIGEIGSLKREREAVVTQIEFDRTALAMFRDLESVQRHGEILDQLRARMPVGHGIARDRFLSGLDSIHIEGLLDAREGVASEMDKIRRLVARYDSPRAIVASLAPVAGRVFELLAKRRPAPLAVEPEAVPLAVEAVDASPVVAPPPAVVSTPPAVVESVPAWRSGLRAMLSRLPSLVHAAGGE